MAVLVLGGAAAWAYVAAGRGAGAVDPTRIVVAARGTMVRSVVATGRIEPVTKVEIKSKANGIVERLWVGVDQRVAPGQVLVELDKENLTARLREARANLQAAEAAHDAAQALLRKNEIEAEAPDVAFATRNLARARRLFDQALVSQATLDEAQSTLDAAENRQRAAVGQLLVARARVTEAAAHVAQALAAVERAEEELANATIRAPIRGTVLTRDVEVGSPVSSILNLGASATLLLTVGDIERVLVRGRVDEAGIGQVRLDQPARITTESFRERAFDGRVTQISPIGVERDNVTTFEVEVSIENPDHELRANMTANAEIILEELPESVIVPEAAISYDAQRNAYVDLLDPAVPEGRRRIGVTVGVGDGTRTQVLESVGEGDRLLLPG